MTAVAEGASIFAESIDWSTTNHARKTANEVVKTDISLSFRYEARTSADVAKIMCILGDSLNGYTIQFISDDTGWSSGNAVLKNNLMLSLPLPKNRENSFPVKVFDEFGHEQTVGTNKIVITKTLATIGAIPASHSIGIEVLNKLGGTPVLAFLVKEGDSLPKTGSITFKAGQTLKAGTNESLNFKLWEGNIESPISDNRWIDVFKIAGTDIDAGVVPTGADIECEYEMSDSGTITLVASIPCIGATFSNHNFYSRREGQVDLADIEGIAEQGRHLIERIDNMAEKIDTPQLAEAKKKAEKAANLDSQPQCEPEDVQKANNELLEAKKLINRTRQANLKSIRQLELDSCVEFFDEAVRQYAYPAEEQSFDNLTRTAQRSIDHYDNDFDNILDSMKTKNAVILLRQDWFVVDWYQRAVANPNNYIDIEKYNELRRQGNAALSNDDINQLRQILLEMLSTQIHVDVGEGMFDNVNVVRG